MGDPVQCGWNELGCTINVGLTPPDKVTTGKITRTHDIDTNHTLVVGGHTIPLCITKRTFSISYETTYSPSSRLKTVYSYFREWLGLGYIDHPVVSQCGYKGQVPTHTASVKENCSIEKSTLHYLDQRYGVCLYKSVKQTIILNKTSSKVAGFKLRFPAGQIFHAIIITEADYEAETVEEWRLVVDGVMTVIAKDTAKIYPFGDPMNYTLKNPAAQLKPEKDMNKILIIPQPPSEALALDEVVQFMGFYDYGNLPGEESDLNKEDGGMKDMYYPEWCRSLQQDPFWRKAADRRYNITWFKDDVVPTSPYTPPDPSVDPIPVGTFARHPVVGDLYQFLVTNLDGTAVAHTSKDINTLINAQLAKSQLGTYGTTLYYPIGVI